MALQEARIARPHASLCCTHLHDVCLASSVTFYECPAIIVPQHTPQSKQSRLIKARRSMYSPREAYFWHGIAGANASWGEQGRDTTPREINAYPQRSGIFRTLESGRAGMFYAGRDNHHGNYAAGALHKATYSCAWQLMNARARQEQLRPPTEHLRPQLATVRQAKCLDQNGSWVCARAD